MAKHTAFRDGLLDGLPIAFGYLCVSVGFGIAAVSNGIPALAAVLISMTNLTSAGQLAGVQLIAAGGLLTEMAAVQLTINCRYALMGISLTQRLSPSFHSGHRLLASFFITDEIFSVASIHAGPITPSYFYGLAAAPYAGWALGTAIGALAGTVLPLQLRYALGIAIYGMFAAILVPAAKADKGTLLAIVTAAVCSTVLYFVPVFQFLSGGFSLILCAIAGAVAAALLFPVQDQEDTV